MGNEKKVKNYLEMALEEVPAQLESIQSYCTEALEDIHVAEEAKALSVKERNTALKLIIGMAVDGYGFDPNATKSPIPKEIADMLFRKGISMEPDTVRKWLHEAADLLPPKEI